MIRSMAALWSKTSKNHDISSEPLAHPFTSATDSFAYSTLLGWLTRYTALFCSFAHSFTPKLVEKKVFFHDKNASSSNSLHSVVEEHDWR